MLLIGSRALAYWDKTFEFSGWYASYDGATYEGFRQVHPKTVTKVEYL
jgi:hypothetical protein